jgi:hypothetical protein
VKIPGDRCDDGGHSLIAFLDEQSNGSADRRQNVLSRLNGSESAEADANSMLDDTGRIVHESD